MKKQIKLNGKAGGKVKVNSLKTTLKSKSPKLSGNATTPVDKKWASLSLDEFINSSASEDNSSSIEDESVDSSAEISDAESEDDESDIEGEDEMEEEDEEDADMDEGDEEDEDSEEESDEDENTAVKKHKKTLDKLKNTDPEFYQFLSENDRELLEFGSSDSEDDERGGQLHELPKPEELEVGSDESDFEDKESSAKRQGNVITQSMVDKWQQELQDPKYIDFKILGSFNLF